MHQASVKITADATIHSAERFKENHVTPWRPSFHRMETNESPLVGGVKNPPGGAALGANSLSS